MGLRIRRSIKLCNGIRLNIGTKGASLSFGVKGLRYSIHSSGKETASIGIPGTGIYYTTSVGGTSKSKSNQYIQKYNSQLIVENQAFVSNYNNKLETITSIHKNCRKEINWNNIKSILPPFNNTQMGPNETMATQAYNNFKPRFYEHIFQQLGKKRKEKLLNEIELSKNKDKTIYSEWENLNTLACNIINGDCNSYLKIIDRERPFDNLLEFGTDFNIKVINTNCINVDFCIMAETIIPNESFSLTKTGKLSRKNMTKTKYYYLKSNYTCSCIIRIAREIFAILPINNLLINANENILNTSTGFEQQYTILSVLIDRNTLYSLNFDTIIPSDAIKNFKHKMKFKKTQGFSPVDKLII